MYVRVCVACVCVCVCVCVCMSVCRFVCACAYAPSVSVRVCAHLFVCVCVRACVRVYLLMATVSPSVELAQGQITSDLSPLVWKTLRKASHDEMDPGGGGHTLVMGVAKGANQGHRSNVSYREDQSIDPPTTRPAHYQSYFFSVLGAGLYCCKPYLGGVTRV